MILGVKKAINKLMGLTPWASNALTQSQTEQTRIFTGEIQANDESVNMNNRIEGNYSVVFYIVFGTKSNNTTTPTEQFYTITSETMELFRVNVQKFFRDEDFIVSKIPVFDNIGTYTDSTTGILTGTFQLNISVIQRRNP